MTRLRSVLHLATCQRIVNRAGSVCSLSSVPTSRGALVWAAALAGLICVPGLVLVGIVGAEGDLFIRSLLFAVIVMMVIVAIASCVARVFDATRWRAVGQGSIVVANVAAFEKGVGFGNALLTEIARLADDEGLTLVLTVRAENLPATRLYRSVGFIAEPAVKVRSGQVAMVRRSMCATRSARSKTELLPGLLVSGCVASVTAVLIGTTTISDPTRVATVAGVCLLCAAAVVDMRAFRLPNRFLAVAAVLAVLAAYFSGSVGSALAAAVMAAAPFLLVHLADPSALGFGDVKFAGVAGALIAPWWWPAAGLIALAALALASVARAIRASGQRALGPSLFAGTAAALLISIVLVEKGLVA